MKILFYIFIIVSTAHGYHPSSAFDQMIMSRTFPFIFNAGSFFDPKVTMSQYNALLQRVATLEGILATIQPKCPALATGGIVIGTYCYTLEGTDTPVTFATAKAGCQAKLGKLAEPSMTDDTFYTNIKTAFPAKTALVTTNIFIGVSSTATSYVYDSTGTTISNNNARWDIIPAVPNVANVGALKPTASSWQLTSAPSTTTYPYLCQYSTIL